VTVLIIAFFAGGIYTSQTFIKDKKSPGAPAFTKISSEDKHEAAVVINEQTTASDSAGQNLPVFDSSAGTHDTIAIATVPKPKINTVRQQSAKETTTTRQTPVIPIPLDNNSEATVENPQKTVIDTAGTQTSVEARPAVVNDQPEKKKGFLKGIFRKKKKEEEKSTEDKNGSQQDSQQGN
jgi:hypothetical protein